MIVITTKEDELKRKEAIRNYLYFMADGIPSEPSEVEKFDRKRKALHEEIFKAYQTHTFLKSHSFDRIRQDLFDMDHFDRISSWFDSIDDAIEYIYWTNQDKLNDIPLDGVKTEYAIYDTIDKSIKNIKKNTKPKIEQCQRIVDEYRKALEAYNKPYKYGDRNYCGYSYDHEQNRWKSVFDDALKIIEDFSKMPREAYTKPAVKAYFHNQVDTINNSISKMYENAFMCLMRWKTWHDGAFWNPDFKF